MAKTPVNLRLDAGLLARIDAYAAERLSNRTAIVQAACLAFLEGARGGVLDLPAKTENLRETAEGEVVMARTDRSASFQAPVKKRAYCPFGCGKVRLGGSYCTGCGRDYETGEDALKDYR